MKRKNSGITLVELIIAITLMWIMVLGLGSITSFSRFHLFTSRHRAVLQNEAGMALEHMTKQVSRAIGNINDYPVQPYADNLGIRVRIDDNPADGKISATDRWIAYRHINVGLTDSEIWYYPDAGTGALPAGNFEVIARRIRISDVAKGIYGVMFNWDIIDPDNFIDVEVTSCWDPDGAPDACGTPENPSVTLSTRIMMPSVSVN